MNINLKTTGKIGFIRILRTLLEAHTGSHVLLESKLHDGRTLRVAQLSSFGGRILYQNCLGEAVSNTGWLEQIKKFADHAERMPDATVRIII